MLLRSGAVAPQEPQEAEAGGVGKPGAAPVQALLPRALWASASPRPLLGLSLHPQMRASDGIGVTSYGSKLPMNIFPQKKTLTDLSNKLMDSLGRAAQMLGSSGLQHQDSP